MSDQWFRAGANWVLSHLKMKTQELTAALLFTRRHFNLGFQAPLQPVKKHFNSQFISKSISAGFVEEQWMWKKHPSQFLQHPQGASSKEEAEKVRAGINAFPLHPALRAGEIKRQTVL